MKAHSSKVQRIGYIRVSSVLQNTDRQLDGLDLDRVFEDKLSGKDTKRPKLQEALQYIRQGDTLVVHSMDRLARNLDDLRQIVKELTGRGVAVQFIKENLTFTGDDSPMANLLLSVMGAFAEFERAIINERQREGVQIAKAKGLYKGRKQVMTSERIVEIKRRIGAGEAKAVIAKDMNISRDTLYRYAKEC
jgi:DNA invertase Pin-like site-specific DNA recombinase